jgi:hypothetical protein
MHFAKRLPQLTAYGEINVGDSNSIAIAITLFFVLILSACGGGTGSSSGGGSGGNGGGDGGGTPPASISQLSPSFVMAGIPVGLVIVFGQGFDSNSQALIDGTPTNTHLLPDGTLEVLPDISPGLTTGIHQFAVQGSGGTSNSLPFTIYVPEQGPPVMKATPAFWVSDFAADPSFIITTDVNGDGLYGRGEVASAKVLEPLYRSALRWWLITQNQIRLAVSVDIGQECRAGKGAHKCLLR